MRVRLLVSQHVPKDGRDSSHHRHASDLRTATQLDSSIPLSHLRILLQEVQHQLTQDEPRDLAAFFGDRTESVLDVA